MEVYDDIVQVVTDQLEGRRVLERLASGEIHAVRVGSRTYTADDLYSLETDFFKNIRS